MKDSSLYRDSYIVLGALRACARMCGDAYGTPKDPNVFYLFNGINVSKSE